MTRTGPQVALGDAGWLGGAVSAHEAGLDMDPFPNVATWLGRVREQPNHVADLEPYPENARRGKSQSIYDLVTIES